MDGKVIKDYLNMTVDTNTLSEEDLDNQLNADSSYDGVLTRGQTGKDARGNMQVNVEDIMAQAFKNTVNDLAKQEKVDTAVKAAAHGIKILAPILQAVSSQGANAEQAAKIMQKVLMRTNADTKLILNAYDLKDGEAPPWLAATVSGQIVTLITNSLNQGNMAILDKPNNDYIKPLITFMKQASEIGAISHPSSSPQNEITSALMLATCAVMAEYQCFNYFHADASNMASDISTFFNDRIIRGTVDDLTARYDLNPNEQAYFAKTLLSSAANLMAAQWKESIEDTVAHIKELPDQARRAIAANGYPLEQIIEKFEKVYLGLELSIDSAIRTMNPGREMRQTQQHAPGQGLA
ncbi:hypothetical protein [Pseudomonas sp. UMAB-40]|uniref:hypothetical protein n=1 Tax=Pseudomonas sp. UMAB-40 TaxID=1365407 RepID=UPI001C599F96|nr:hypothetical protein [Pseudomonas sp. UMAB-40]